jgi:hypothetical protein
VAGDTEVYLARASDRAVVAFPKSGGASRNLVRLEQPVRDMVLAGGALWLTSGGRVERLGLDGGAEALVASHLSLPGAIATDGATVFVTDLEARDGGLVPRSSVLRLPAHGGAAAVVGAADGEIDALALDATHVYWADPLDGSIVSVPKEGGTARTLASERGLPGKLRLYRGKLFWVERRTESIWTMPASGGAPVQFTQDFAGFADLVVDERGVWWSNEGAVDGAFRVLFAAKPGEAIGASPAVVGIDALASDGHQVFWAREGAVSRVGGDE